MRRVSSLVSCALFVLVACKDTSSPGSAGPPPTSPPVTTPPADGTPAGEQPTSEPQPPPGVVVSPKPAPEAKTPDKPAPGNSVECTPDTRKGGMCTREYRPVCGSFADKTSKTFSNKCVACSDEKITSYVDGPCAGTI